MEWTLAAYEIRICFCLFAPNTVFCFICIFVDIAIIRNSFPKILSCCFMMFISCSNEMKIICYAELLELIFERNKSVINKFLSGHPRCRCCLVNFHSMLICSRIEKYIKSHRHFIASDNISTYEFERMPHMERRIHVWECGCNVERF